MVQIYNPDNTEFDYNGDMILLPEAATVHVILGSTWEAEITHPIDDEGRWAYIVENAVVKMPSFNGEQLWRIVSTEKTDTGVSAAMQPIFYDAANEVFLVDVRPTDKSGQEALDILMEDTKYSGESDIETPYTAYYEYKNLLEALNGDIDQSFVNRWGGEIIYDNFKVIINTEAGEDNGVEIRYGKNIPENGFTVTEDMSEVVTRIYPKGYDGVTMTDDGYVDSDHIDDYPTVRAATITYDYIYYTADMDEDEITELEEDDSNILCSTQSELDEALTEACEAEFNDGIDVPAVTIECDMVLLQNTEQYKDVEVLEDVSLGDTIYIVNSHIGFETTARVIELEYDSILQRITSVVIGDFEYDYFSESAKTASELLSSVSDLISSVGEFKTVITEELYAVYANIETLTAGYAEITELKATVATIEEAYIDEAYVNTLLANYASIEYLKATYASIEMLESTTADIEALFADYASIEYLEANYVTTTTLTADLAYIDETYIKSATVTELLADYVTATQLYALTGTVEDLTATYLTVTGDETVEGDLTINGLLSAVYASIGTVAADYISANTAVINTIIADYISANTAEFYTIVANYISSNSADIESIVSSYIITEYLTAAGIESDTITVGDIFGLYATIDYVDSNYVTTTALTAEIAAIEEAYITSAAVTELLADYATVTELNAVSVTISSLSSSYAEIDFSNVDVSNVVTEFVSDLLTAQGFLASSATIDTVSVTSYLTGVGIIADYITAGTLDCTNITVANLSVGVLTVDSINGYTLAGSTVDADNLEELLTQIMDAITTTDDEVAEALEAAGLAATEVSTLSSTVITDIEIQYYLSTSSETTEGGSWSSSAPEWTEGTYVWTRNLITYGNGSTVYSDAVCITGNSGSDGTNGSDGENGSDGSDGVGIKSITNYYLLSTSNTDYESEYSTSSALVDYAIVDSAAADYTDWSTTVPTMTAEYKYLWCYTVIEYTDGSTSVCEPYVLGTYGDTGADGADGTSFAWNLFEGTSDSWQEASLGQYFAVLYSIDFSDLDVSEGDYLTVSGYLKGGSSKTIYPRVQFYTSDSVRTSIYDTDHKVTEDEETYFSYSWAVTSTQLEYTTLQFCIQNANPTIITSTTVEYYKSIKLEYGDTASAWSPAYTELAGAVEEVQEQLEEVISIANGKSTTYFSATAPSSSDFDLQENDVWFDTDDGNAMYMYDGTAWEKCEYGTSAIAASAITAELIAAEAVTTAKIAAGAVTSNEIAANTITASNILAGTITSSEIDTDSIATAVLSATYIQASTLSIGTDSDGNVIISDGKITASMIDAETITGDMIVSNSITATQIAAGTITSSEIDVSSITAAILTAGSITATMIASGAVTADKISVSDLSALGATIGGFTIGTTALYSDSDTYEGENNVYLGTNGISLGDTFSVDSTGNLSATQGTIGAITLSTTGLYSCNMSTTSGVVGVGTAGYAVVGTITADNYAGIYKPSTISSSSIAFFAGATSAAGASAAFSVTYGGTLTATDAVIEGEITATSGTIGGFTIGSSSIYTNYNSFAGYSSNIYIGSSGISLGTAFKVTYTGVLTATSATITGTIYASGGTIGGFTIGSSSIYTSYNSFATYSSNIYIGSSGISLGTVFSVTPAGYLTATSGLIGAFYLGSTALYTSSSSYGTVSNNIYIGTSGISLSTTFKVSAAGALTATSGTIGAITLSSTGLYAYNSSYSSSYAGIYRPSTITTSSIAFFAGATSASGTSAAFSVTYGGALTATDATISGTFTSESGSYMAKLTSGNLYFYYDDDLMGSYGSTYLTGDSTVRGVRYGLAYDGDFMSFSYQTSSGSSYQAFLAYDRSGDFTGYSGHVVTLKPIIMTDILRINDTYLAPGSHLYFSDYLGGSSYTGYLYVTSSYNVYLSALDNDLYICGNNLYLGDDGYDTYLKGDIHTLSTTLFVSPLLFDTGFGIEGQWVDEDGNYTVAYVLSVTETSSYTYYTNLGATSYYTLIRGEYIYVGYDSYSTHVYLGTTSTYTYVRGAYLYVGDDDNPTYIKGSNGSFIVGGVLAIRSTGSYINIYSSAGYTRLGNSSYYTYIYGSTIYMNGSAYSSDISVKNSITTMDDSYLDLIDRLTPRSFYYNWNSEDYCSGFIAQEVMEALEEVGITNDTLIRYNENEGTYALDYNGFIPILVAAVKELRSEVAALQTELSVLRSA